MSDDNQNEERGSLPNNNGRTSPPQNGSIAAAILLDIIDRIEQQDEQLDQPDPQAVLHPIYDYEGVAGPSQPEPLIEERGGQDSLGPQQIEDSALMGLDDDDDSEHSDRLPIIPEDTILRTSGSFNRDAHIGPRSGSGTTGSNKKGNYGTGKETLRLRAKGPATIEKAPNDVVQAAVDKINNLLESFMGINDSELATQIWDLGKEKANPHDFVTAIDSSDLEAFGFTDDFVFDLWGAISDAKTGRLKKDNHRTPL